MNLHTVVKQVLPPFLFKILRSLHHQLFPSQNLYLSGNYSSWPEAARASTGYDSDIILEKTKEALIKVKSGEAIYERDSVLFDEIQYSWPLLAGLMWAAARSGGRLNVLDFGGSLGSTYFQNRAFLKKLPNVRWSVIEQPEYIRVGKELFEDEILKFYPSIDDYSTENAPDIIVLSGVLQYLESPYDILNQLLELHPDCIILDRMPFGEGEEDHICVQHVPASIYPASYPIRILSKSKFLRFVQKNNLNVVAEFDALDKLPGPIELAYHGMIITKTDT